MHKVLFYNNFIICLYRFRGLCAHHQEVKIVLYIIWYLHTCSWPSGAIRLYWDARSAKHKKLYNSFTSLFDTDLVTLNFNRLAMQVVTSDECLNISVFYCLQRTAHCRQFYCLQRTAHCRQFYCLQRTAHCRQIARVRFVKFRLLWQH